MTGATQLRFLGAEGGGHIVFSLCLFILSNIDVRACASHIYKHTHAGEKCRAPSTHRTAVTLQQQDPTRPTRANLSTANGLPLQRLATLSPCSFEFIGACSNIHKKGTSLAERSPALAFPPRPILTLRFSLVLQHHSRSPPPSLPTAVTNYYTDF